MADFCPRVENICISRGDTPIIPVGITNRVTGAVEDITGYTFTLTVDPSPSPSTAATNLFSVVGVVTDAANGRVEFQPTETNTDLSPSVYFYDVQMVTTAPSKRSVLAGRFEVKQDITKT